MEERVGALVEELVDELLPVVALVHELILEEVDPSTFIACRRGKLVGAYAQTLNDMHLLAIAEEVTPIML